MENALEGWKRGSTSVLITIPLATWGAPARTATAPTRPTTIPVPVTEPWLLGWSADGKQLLVRGKGSELVRVTLPEGRPVSRWRVPGGAAGLGVRPDGKRLAALDTDRRLRIWDVERRRVVRTLPRVAPFDDLAWSPDGSRLAVARAGADRAGEAQGRGYRLRLNDRHRVEVYDLRSGRRLRSIRHLSADGPVEGHGFTGFSAGWSPNGRYLATGMMAGELLRDSPLQVWDTATGKLAHRLGKLRGWVPWSGSGDAGAAPVWSPDGRHLAAAWSGSAVRLWNARTGALERSLPAGEGPCEIAWSPDGEYLAARSFDDYWGDKQDHTAVIWVWHRASGRRVARFTERRVFLNGLCWSPGGSALASAGSDGKVRIWRVPRGR
jgi:WD40 repeat protein